MLETTVDQKLLAELGGPGEPVYWEHLTSPESRELVGRCNAAILPCGAIEQHGPHMPMSVDWLMAAHVSRSISALTGVPVLHPLAYGVSGSHGTFPGTLGLSPATYLAVVADLCGWLYRSGVRQFILLNGHAWNMSPLQVCAEELRTRYDDVRVRAMDYAESYPGAEIDGHVTHGRLLAHANYFETSCMMYIAPELVHIDRAVSEGDWPTFWDYRADQVSESGVWGSDIPQANAENGQREMTRCVETTARAIAEGLAEPLVEARRQGS